MGGSDDKIGNLGVGGLDTREGLGAQVDWVVLVPSEGVSPVSKSVGHRMRRTHQGLLLLRAQQITVDL